jgi:hypothetical protein
VDQDH